MQIVFLPEANKELNFWAKTGNKSILKKITQFLAAIISDPFKGIGKPEQLKHQLSHCWSRRINSEHRIVYEVLQDRILIHSVKGHY